MSRFIDLLHEGKTSAVRSRMRSILEENRNSALLENRKQIGNKILPKRKLEEQFLVVQTQSDSIGSMAAKGAKVLMKFSSIDQAKAFLATSGVAPVSTRKNVFMDYSRFYHIILDRDFEKAKEEIKDEEANIEDTPEYGEYDGNGAESNSIGADMSEETIVSFNEASNILDQIEKISKSRDGKILFEDGNESPLTKESAKEILSLLNKKSLSEKTKLSGKLSKNLDSFLTVLNTTITEERSHAPT